MKEGKTGIVNLHDHPEDDVDTLLRFIYSGSLDMTKFNLKSGSFVVYSNLYNLGEQFQVEALCDDALTLLGQYADQKLEEICSYDRATSGRHGVENNTVDLSYVEEDLFRAIWAAYGSVQHSTRLQSLLASFVWAGRDRLLPGFAEGFMNLADRVPQFGTDIFKLMLGNNTSQWIPSAEAVRDACTGFDHTRKTQHPDRCEWCDEVFDEVKNKKAMYNPFKAVTRPVAWCEPCVDAKKSVLWRVEGEDVEEEKSP
ncbi:hypothetical protein QBC46DRAFT_270445 [Diplogelasinospora grovesii]|uniref:BTB domain-containing protein n=1 Tax=Diplogelasinospora grovesii TaxID=303347 RepID=A0AAN6N243_9PEZI|nr:hypothetical protein QBC46DRAFT_270445 [Diplogelasinospora grovesii]